MKTQMVKRIALVILFLVGWQFMENLHSQENKKEKSLLWEVSGNHLLKPSYLYGTMHVSNKIAFNLCDTFFTAIEKSDVVSLEINDEEFLEEMASNGLLDYYFYKYESDYERGDGNFYKNAFTLKAPDYTRLFDQTYLYRVVLNDILYRFDEDESEYEENTYLDMYVHQTGKKLNKQIAGLETYEQVMYYGFLAALKNDSSTVYKPRRGRYDREKIEKAYRLGDIYTLDSINNQFISEGFKKYILDQRNINFVHKIDSFIKNNQSIFAAFGCAHLPGEKGVINLLRQKGYHVRPVSMLVTKKGQQKRAKTEKIICPVKFKKMMLADSFITVSLPGRYLENNSIMNKKEYFYPDLANGAYFSILRINTFASFYEKSEQEILSSIDSIVYYNIPGKIISKNTLVKDDYKGIEIENITRRGEHQKYQVFVTPMEIIVFKMNSTEDYFKLYGDIFFNSISFRKNNNNKLIPMNASANGFKIDLPSLRNINLYENYNQSYLCQAYSGVEDNYYFLIRSKLFDYDYIEEDTFELNFLADMFSTQLGLTKDTQYLVSYDGYPALNLVLNCNNIQKIYARMLIKGPSYFLVGIKTSSPAQAKEYLNSFHFIPVSFPALFSLATDTILHYSLLRPDSESKYEKISRKYRDIRNYYEKKRETKRNSYQEKKHVNFSWEASGEQIVLHYNKYDPFDIAENPDTFWVKEIADLNNDESFRILKIKKYQQDNRFYLDLVLIDTNSIRTINHQLILNGNELYRMTYISDSISKPDSFIHTILSSFKPTLKCNTSPIRRSYADAILAALNGDSISKVKAIEHIKDVKFDKSQNEKITKMIPNIDHKGIGMLLKSALILKLGDTSSQENLSFLEDYYSQVIDTATLAFSILKAVTSSGSDQSVKVFIKLLGIDLPLGDNYAVSNVFNNLRQNPDNAIELFPDILRYTRYSEYKDEIYELMAFLVRSGKMSKDVYAKELNFICTDANDELKRFSAKNEDNGYHYYRSYEFETTSEYFEDDHPYNYSYSGNYRDNEISELIDYMTILMPFYEQSQVKKFFDKVNKSKHDMLKLELCMVMIRNDMNVCDSICSYYASSNKYRLIFYEKLKKINKLSIIKPAYLTQIDFAKSLLYGGNEEFDDDSIIFIGKNEICLPKQDGYVYYFKRKNNKTGNWFVDYTGIQPEDSSQISTRKYIAVRYKPLLINDPDKNKLPAEAEVQKIIQESFKKFRLIGRARALKNFSDRDDY